MQDDRQPAGAGLDAAGLEQRVHGFLDLAALAAAVELGLPEALAEAQTVDDLQHTLGVQRRALAALLGSLCWLGVLTEREGAFALTPRGAALFGPGPETGLPTLAYFRSRAEGWLALSAALRDGDPKGVVPWAHAAGVEHTALPARAMILPELLAAHLPVPPDGPCPVPIIADGSIGSPHPII